MPKRFNHSISNLTNIKHLVFVKSSQFNQSLTNIILNSLITLHFGDLFNSPIENNNFPNLQELIFNETSLFDQSIDNLRITKVYKNVLKHIKLIIYSKYFTIY